MQNAKRKPYLERDDSRDSQTDSIRVDRVVVRVRVENLVDRLTDKQRQCSLRSYIELAGCTKECIYDSRY